MRIKGTHIIGHHRVEKKEENNYEKLIFLNHPPTPIHTRTTASYCTPAAKQPLPPGGGRAQHQRRTT